MRTGDRSRPERFKRRLPTSEVERRRPIPATERRTRNGTSLATALNRHGIDAPGPFLAAIAEVPETAQALFRRLWSCNDARLHQATVRSY